MAIAHVVTKGYGNYGATSVTPCTLTVTDNADGTGGVATISGSQGGTVTVYSLSPNGSGWREWTSRGSRTGDGNITLALPDGDYWWYAEEAGIKSNHEPQEFTGETRIAAIESAFAQLLRNNADVTAMVGQRIHINRRKQGDQLPAIVISKVESGDDHTIAHDETWRQPKVLVEVFAENFLDADELAELVRELEDTDGTITCYKGDGSAWRSIDVNLIEIEDEDLECPPPVDGSDNWTERHAILFNVICQRP